LQLRLKGDLDLAGVLSLSTLTAGGCLGFDASDFAWATNPASRFLNDFTRRAAPTTASLAADLKPLDTHLLVKETPRLSQAEQVTHQVSPSNGGACLHFAQDIQSF